MVPFASELNCLEASTSLVFGLEREMCSTVNFRSVLLHFDVHAPTFHFQDFWGNLRFGIYSSKRLYVFTLLSFSRNQLSYLPPSICQLPCLQGLILNNNRLVSLPEEIGKMTSLTELDASCNEITHLPVQIGDLAALKSLNLRRNHLQEVPVGK